MFLQRLQSCWRSNHRPGAKQYWDPADRHSST
ncbi:hypothetical protein [Enterobacter cloacae]